MSEDEWWTEQARHREPLSRVLAQLGWLLLALSLVALLVEYALVHQQQDLGWLGPLSLFFQLGMLGSVGLLVTSRVELLREELRARDTWAPDTKAPDTRRRDL